MGDEPPRRRHRLRPLLLASFLLAAAALLVGWNRVASSPSLCGSCHAMREATLSSARSVHADVPCLACHTQPGLVGALRYVPTLAREGLATATGWEVAGGVLDAAACDRCHTDIRSTPALAKVHPAGSSSCASCHGEVAHPVATRPPPGPHVRDYTQTHGRDVASKPGECTSCHRPVFCQACHFRTTFPHPKGWISQHGPVEEAKGPSACTLCHPTTFCVGCHGTEIPHRATWLGEHWRALEDASTSPCYVCHPRTDCTACHANHDIHREQGLYA